MAKTDAVWTELNPASLPTEIATAYANYKDAYKYMKEQRVAFETSLEAAATLPEGKRMVFGYNFGKLSVAIVDDDRKPAKATPVKQSLGDYLDGLKASGRGA